jgi:RimJ/RimL family protein N-acetyltransferase
MIYARRIRLRAAEREDIPQFVDWLNDPEVRQFLLLNLPISRVEEEGWFERMIKSPPQEHVLVIEAQTGDSWKPIGNTGLTDINWVDRNAEIGIFIGEKDYWNRGYGREVMKLMLRHAFNTLNLHRIYLRVFEHNLRGIRAYEHAGFVQEGRLRHDIFRDGQYHDVFIFSVLRPDWQDSDF